MNLSERTRIAVLSADRSRRALVARVLYSPLLRWRLGPFNADQLLIVPQDLRSADPSFQHEIELGQFGLAGTIAVLDGVSPFELPPPNEAWARSLHGFGWLRHLDSGPQPGAKAMAQGLAVEWTLRHRGGSGLPWEPAVTARRMISWLSHAGLLLEGADAKTFDAVTRSLAEQLVRLSAAWRDAPGGYPRLLALIALVLADLTVAGHDRQLPDAEALLVAEIGRQIMDDGGHISRNPCMLVEILLDVLPLRQCFVSRKRTLPKAIESAMQRMIMMLRHMRHGDGMLARFNGVSVAAPAGLATVLAYDDLQDSLPILAPQSRYARLSRGDAVVLVDVGSPPPLESAGEAHAGCLSFELSHGTQLVVVNGGAPGPADGDWRPASRATASHNTLCLDEQSSSRMVRHKTLEDLIGAPPICLPDAVEATIEDHGGSLELDAVHDGYVGRTGLVHRRSLALGSDGRRLLGIDRLAGRKVKVRLRRDLPFSIHFHLHPDATCKRGVSANEAEIALRDGQIWRFTLEGARLAIEESTYFADSSGPRASLQIVARGSTFGESEVRWVLEAC